MPQGTIEKHASEFFILSLLKETDSRGYDITRNIPQMLKLHDGQVYPMLLRFRKERLVSVYYRKYHSRQTEKYYRITYRGRLRHLSLMTDFKKLHHFIHPDSKQGGLTHDKN